MGELASFPLFVPKTPLAVTVTNWNQLISLNKRVSEIAIPSNSMNETSLIVLNLSRFRRLKKLVIGDECFMNVKETRLTGLYYLESVEIGVNSFTQHKNGYGDNPNRHFYLKNCPKLKSLKIGRYSFSDYSVIEIENVNALETIEMGDLSDKECNSFRDASLTLRDLPALRTLVFGRGAFSNCLQAVFENLPELESIRMGYSAFAFGYENTTKLVMKSCACSVR